MRQCRTYKNVFEKIKKNSKKLFYQDKLKNFQTNITKNMEYNDRNSLEDLSERNQFSKKSNGSGITKKSLIAKHFNDFFVNIGPKHAFVILHSTKTFQTFLSEINTVLNGTELTEKEFLNVF